jgi:hypothetical protein
MKRSRVPEFVWDKLDELEKAVKHLSEKVARTESSIPAARMRLTGTFRTLAEEQDL